MKPDSSLKATIITLTDHLISNPQTPYMYSAPPHRHPDILDPNTWNMWTTYQAYMQPFITYVGKLLRSPPLYFHHQGQQATP